MFKGISASDGIAIGYAVVIKELGVNVDKVAILNVAEEVSRFKAAVKKAEIQLEKLRDNTEKKFGIDKAQIFDAHILMLSDPEFVEGVIFKINEEKVNAEHAVSETVKTFMSIFEAMENEYMRERAADIGDIGKRLIYILLGHENKAISEIDMECIIVAKDLAPSDTAQINKERILGFVTEIGGRTSHTAIMARSIEIPAVVGISNITELVKNGDLIIIDGNNGNVIINPDGMTLKEYMNNKFSYNEELNELQKYAAIKTVTLDGREVEVSANIGDPQNVEGALKYGADGIGLFRSEFLYMGSDRLPTEEEQFKAYREVVENMGVKPVIIRTLDIGGDKSLPYLNIGHEMNPFLGYRAIRVCLDRQDIFKTQLRAILRASAFGNLRIMFPMISGIEELLSAKAIVAEVKLELLSDNILFNEKIELGIMIEIPSAAILSDILAKEVDFFSIGTNDLIQYTVAVDRMNEKISNLYNSCNPAVLRLIKLVIENGHKEGKKVYMCGEAASDPALIPVFLGFGLDEFSMSPASILKARQLITNLSYSESKEISEKVLSFTHSEDIETYLGK
jgi:phosphoenolpyruvate-protein phosphotransferase (PTS system enzyme I)